MFALAVATLWCTLHSELLVMTLAEVEKQTQLSQPFMAIVLIPVVGNAAEHISVRKLRSSFVRRAR